MPSKRSRRVSSNPDMTAMTTFNVITAIITPNTLMTVIKEMKVSRRRACKYLRAMKSSYFMQWENLLGLRAQQRKENHFANRCRVGKKHDETVDADALPSRRRHTELERPHVVIVDGIGSLVAGAPRRHLFEKTLALIGGVVELGERVGQLATADVEFEAVNHRRILIVFASQRGHLDRITGDESRLNELRLSNLFKDLHQGIAVSGFLIDMNRFALGVIA